MVLTVCVTEEAKASFRSTPGTPPDAILSTFWRNVLLKLAFAEPASWLYIWSFLWQKAQIILDSLRELAGFPLKRCCCPSFPNGWKSFLDLCLSVKKWGRKSSTEFKIGMNDLVRDLNVTNWNLHSTIKITLCWNQICKFTWLTRWAQYYLIQKVGNCFS